MTNQEKKFADEYVFHYFNSNRNGWNIAVEAAKYAGYTLPVNDDPGAELVAKALYNKDEVKTYIDSQILAYKDKLHPSQRRTLWAAITAMNVGEPCDWENWGFVNR